ncbi:MFS transporter [Spiribacter halobius]|uniref:MFS transporter n=1 Tax=Sediminicurvatus halobius TaxID=2182432 RepID=A0A2U2MY03_9GAMM|nr:MFS transporter [Spiribacter halobius]PWG61826.1 MFS transporter [Spiribacter halobius]UEX77667.1 MFS transporter [Spiribacter halobius]
MSSKRSGNWSGLGAIGAVIACGCLISLITFGVRSIFGLFTDPVSGTHGWSREVFALAIALQNLFWGIAQPFAGALVDRFGAARVLAAGGALYALGVATMAFASTPMDLHLGAGVLVGVGMGGASFVTVLGALGRIVPESHRSWALGLATAAGSLGQFVFAPLGQGFIGAYGWQQATLLLAAMTCLVPLLALGFRGRAQSANQSLNQELDLGIKWALRSALKHGSYWLLLFGFFVCGFQLAFMMVHLPPYLTDLDVSGSVIGWALALIGLANIVGSYGSGLLGSRHSKRAILSFIYFGRAALITWFVLTPPSAPSVLLFSVVVGLLWLSTVPATSGLVAVMFGTRYMGTLFGLVFFTHQLGSFAGVWLGGALFELTGDYGLIWWLVVGLGVFAGLVHLPIVEKRARAFEVPQPNLSGEPST